MPTANEEILNGSLERQVRVQRFLTTEVNKFLSELRKTDGEINRLLRENLPVRLRSRAFNRLLALLVNVRQGALDRFKEGFSETLLQLIEQEKISEANLLTKSSPIELILGPAKLSNEDILRIPFQTSTNQSATVESLFSSILRSDRERIEAAIQLGLRQGESVEQIIRRLRGTSDSGFTNGVYSTTRRQAETLVRTIVNHISNETRNAVFDANSDIIIANYWVSTLDLRTSAICRYRDGRFVPIGDNKLPSNLPLLQPSTAIPPAHFNCRSILVALISLDSIVGERPFVDGVRRNFRSEAREKYGQNWRNLSQRERDRLTALERERFLDENVGRVPARTTYYEWLKNRSPESQDRVLGPVRAALFREGKVQAEQLHNPFGDLLTLEQLGAI